MKKELYLSALLLLKYLPIVGVGACVIYISYLLYGNRLVIEDGFTGTIFMFLMLLLFVMCNILFVVFSVLMEFCHLHRKMFYYQTLVSVCIAWEQLIGFGSVLTPCRWIVLLLGLWLLFALCKDWVLYRNNKPKIKGREVRIG